MSQIGFVKLVRSAETAELLGDPKALHLLTVIAIRARYVAEPSLGGLTFGQALLGDDRAIGMTRAERRQAEGRLEKMGLARFKRTPRGTVATLTDSRVFSLRDERKNNHPNSQPSSERNGAFTANSSASFEPANDHLAANEQPLTRRKEGENGEEEDVMCSPGGEQRLPPLEVLEGENPDIDQGMLATAYQQTEADLERGRRITSPVAYCLGLARKIERDRSGGEAAGF